LSISTVTVRTSSTRGLPPRALFGLPSHCPSRSRTRRQRTCKSSTSVLPRHAPHIQSALHGDADARTSALLPRAFGRFARLAPGQAPAYLIDAPRRRCASSQRATSPRLHGSAPSTEPGWPKVISWCGKPSRTSRLMPSASVAVAWSASCSPVSTSISPAWLAWRRLQQQGTTHGTTPRNKVSPLAADLHLERKALRLPWSAKLTLESLYTASGPPRRSDGRRFSERRSWLPLLPVQAVRAAPASGWPGNPAPKGAAGCAEGEGYCPASLNGRGAVVLGVSFRTLCALAGSGELSAVPPPGIRAIRVT